MIHYLLVVHLLRGGALILPLLAAVLVKRAHLGARNHNPLVDVTRGAAKLRIVEPGDHQADAKGHESQGEDVRGDRPEVENVKVAVLLQPFAKVERVALALIYLVPVLRAVEYAAPVATALRCRQICR